MFTKIKYFGIVFLVALVACLSYFFYSYYQLNTEVQQDHAVIASFSAVDKTTGLNGFSIDVYLSSQAINKALEAQTFTK